MLARTLPPLLVLSLVLRLLVSASSSLPVDPAIADPPWPGGAFPPLPSWSTWSLRGSTAGFFLGNTSGPNGPGESLREASLGVVGWGGSLVYGMALTGLSTAGWKHVSELRLGCSNNSHRT